MKQKKILVIEDEKPIADLISYGLKKEGFIVKTANNGADGLTLVDKFTPDLMLLDLMLPDISGFDICKNVVEVYNIPIIMLTAKFDINDRVQGLEYGADDYITKPFDLREVVARIKTILRRINQFEVDKNKFKQDVIEFKGIEIYKDEHMVKKDGKIVGLTPKEYELLVALYNSDGRVLARSQLLDVVWGYDYVGDTRTVDMHIQRLRKKLGSNDIIKTVFGVGYKINKWS
ncbi:transcriptional regulatory protein SrrA [Gottschalkia purinilytica]|uniref:Transcriptional regulatory protein SrrA n=1 Tax=Gottschalkia purinilytica TaxID=1503 RepID=A0A0L0W844_GOTPU|nr:response regulator transcription factor [Gottschalkia purinilytica]KNF07743.1 transcriptional regulatory protein SrrA [Gottschalkia purinilytica]